MPQNTPLFEVYKNNNLVFSGSDFACYRYVLNHQPQSVAYAEKYEGWKIKAKEENNASDT